MQQRKLCVVLGVVVFISVSSISYTQDTIDNFFDSLLPYSAYEVKGSVFPGGKLAKFSLEKWNYSKIFRSPVMDGLIPSNVSNHLVTSNQLDFRMSHEKNSGSYVANGVEVYFSRPTSLDTLGYKAAKSFSDTITSHYFMIVFLQRDTTTTAHWRLIAYLDELFNITGEIIGYEQIYFIRSLYRKLPRRGNRLVDSQIPSLIVIERLDQSILGIINILGKKIIWVLDDLSYDEQTVMSFASGAFFAMRFHVGNDGRLKSQHNRALRLLKDNGNGTNIIDDDFMLSPQQLGD